MSAIPPLPLSSQIRTAVTPFLRENNLWNWVLILLWNGGGQVEVVERMGASEVPYH